MVSDRVDKGPSSSEVDAVEPISAIHPPGVIHGEVLHDCSILGPDRPKCHKGCSGELDMSKAQDGPRENSINHVR